MLSDYFDWESTREDLNDLQTPPEPKRAICAFKKHYMVQLLSLRAGMIYAIKQTMRLRESGLLWGGVPCSLLVWLSLGSSLRHIYFPMGDPESECVRLSNLCLSRFGLLVLIAIARTCYWGAEQPSSSLLKDIPCYDQFLHVPGLKNMMTRLSLT